MFDWIRARTWEQSRSHTRLLKLVGGRASARKVRLFAIAVGRICWDPPPHWLGGTEYERAVLQAIGIAEQWIDGAATQVQMDHALDTAEGIVSDLRLMSREAFLLRPTARVGQSLLELIRTGRIGPDAFSKVKPPLLVNLLRHIFGNPFRPVAFDAAWRSDTVLSLAKHMYESRDFSAMPILADALQDSGCEHADILAHCRDESLTHVRGCWVVDLVLGKS